MKLKTLFGKPKSKYLSSKISIESPDDFRQSVKTLSKGGLSYKEKKALVLARTRAKLQLKRSDLSLKERKQMYEISKVEIPAVRK